MSGTLEVQADETPKRVSQAERRAARAEQEPQAAGVVEAFEPDDALADSRRHMETETRNQVAEAQRRQQAAEQARQQAEQEVQRQRAARAQDRQTSLAAMVDAASSEIEAAERAYEMAREAGNVKDEIAASKALASAQRRLENASEQLEAMKGAPTADPGYDPGQPAPQAAPQRQVSPAAQRWLDNHPRFFSDPQYKQDALAAHAAAVMSGCVEGSEAYIEAIDRQMDRLYPPEGRAVQERQPYRGGEGAPVSRGSGERAGGFKTVHIPTLGELKYHESQDGRRTIRFTSQKQADDFKEMAAVVERGLYEKDPNKALFEYANSQINCVLEGAYDTDFKDGEGKTFR